MNKKKVALTACAAALVGTLAVGGTLAYLTQVTNTVDNVFASDSNLTGELVEPSWNQETASKYVPGQTIAKDPQLKSTCDFDAYVAMKVVVKDNDGNVISLDDFQKTYATIDDFNTAAWDEIAKNDNYALYMYKTTLDKNTTTAPLFTKVTTNAKMETIYNKTTEVTVAYKQVDQATYEAAQGNKKEVDGKYYVEVSVDSKSYDSTATYYVLKDGSKMEVENLGKLPKFDIVVTGYMVQADNVDVNTAKTELTNLAATK